MTTLPERPARALVVVDMQTDVLAGSNRKHTTTRQRWTLRLRDDPRTPGVVVAARGVVPGRRGR